MRIGCRNIVAILRLLSIDKFYRCIKYCWTMSAEQRERRKISRKRGPDVPPTREATAVPQTSNHVLSPRRPKDVQEAMIPMHPILASAPAAQNSSMSDPEHVSNTVHRPVLAQSTRETVDLERLDAILTELKLISEDQSFGRIDMSSDNTFKKADDAPWKLDKAATDINPAAFSSAAPVETPRPSSIAKQHAHFDIKLPSHRRWMSNRKVTYMNGLLTLEGVGQFSIVRDITFVGPYLCLDAKHPSLEAKKNVIALRTFEREYLLQARSKKKVRHWMEFLQDELEKNVPMSGLVPKKPESDPAGLPVEQYASQWQPIMVRRVDWSILQETPAPSGALVVWPRKPTFHVSAEAPGFPRPLQQRKSVEPVQGQGQGLLRGVRRCRM